jgi:hypothetical protein
MTSVDRNVGPVVADTDHVAPALTASASEASWRSALQNRWIFDEETLTAPGGAGSVASASDEELLGVTASNVVNPTPFLRRGVKPSSTLRGFCLLADSSRFLYVHGGVEKGDRALGSLYQYDCHEHVWSQILCRVQATPPPAPTATDETNQTFPCPQAPSIRIAVDGPCLAHHAGSMIQNNLLFHGGKDEVGQVRSEVYLYHFERRSWELVDKAVGGVAPPPMYGHSISPLFEPGTSSPPTYLVVGPSRADCKAKVLSRLNIANEKTAKGGSGRGRKRSRVSDRNGADDSNGTPSAAATLQSYSDETELMSVFVLDFSGPMWIHIPSDPSTLRAPDRRFFSVAVYAPGDIQVKEDLTGSRLVGGGAGEGPAGGLTFYLVGGRAGGQWLRDVSEFQSQLSTWREIRLDWLTIGSLPPGGQNSYLPSIFRSQHNRLGPDQIAEGDTINLSASGRELNSATSEAGSAVTDPIALDETFRVQGRLTSWRSYVFGFDTLTSAAKSTVNPIHAAWVAADQRSVLKELEQQAQPTTTKREPTSRRGLQGSDTRAQQPRALFVLTGCSLTKIPIDGPSKGSCSLQPLAEPPGSLRIRAAIAVRRSFCSQLLYPPAEDALTKAAAKHRGISVTSHGTSAAASVVGRGEDLSGFSTVVGLVATSGVVRSIVTTPTAVIPLRSLTSRKADSSRSTVLPVVAPMVQSAPPKKAVEDDAVPTARPEPTQRSAPEELEEATHHSPDGEDDDGGFDDFLL